MNPETSLQNEILIALSAAGCTVWRVETSGVWMGKVINKTGRQVTLTNARMMTSGLCVGGSDIIGIAPDGRFLAVEVKTKKGQVSKEQVKFIKAVKAAAAVAGVARSVEDALQLIASSK